MKRITHIEKMGVFKHESGKTRELFTGKKRITQSDVVFYYALHTMIFIDISEFINDWERI